MLNCVRICCRRRYFWGRGQYPPIPHKHSPCPSSARSAPSASSHHDGLTQQRPRRPTTPGITSYAQCPSRHYIYNFTRGERFQSCCVHSSLIWGGSALALARRREPSPRAFCNPQRPCPSGLLCFPKKNSPKLFCVARALEGRKSTRRRPPCN